MGQDEFAFGQTDLAYVAVVLVFLRDLAAVDVCSELAVHVALVAERIQKVELIPQPSVHTGFNLA